MSDADERRFRNILGSFAPLHATSSEQTAPCFGRDEAVTSVLQSLDAGATVILRGPSGIGKSAIWREVGRRLSAGDCPAGLHGYKLLRTSVAQLQQGCVYSGWWEQKLNELVGELLAARKAGRRHLLVVTDFGNLFRVSRTSRDDQKVIADDVLTYVESGQLAVAGELTPQLFRPGLADDPRWLSRVRIIDLPPLSGQLLRRVLRHSIAASPAGPSPLPFPASWQRGEPGPPAAEAILERAVELSGRFLPTVAQPAAALKLLQRAIEWERWGEEALAEAVSQETGVPLAIVSDEHPLPQEVLHARLGARVIGQDEAVGAVAETLVLIKAGLTDPRRPLGVHLYTGPSGTGKTELAKATAEVLFGDERALVRLDMSEYFGSTSAERFSRDLVTRVADRPLCILLLDEVEKADAGALDILLQVCGEGRVTSPTGQVADLRQALIVLTANIGFGQHDQPADAGRPARGFALPGATSPPAEQDAVYAALRQRFRPELVGRLDQIVIFRPLGATTLCRIVERELHLALQLDGLARRNLLVEWDATVIEALASRATDPRYGARPWCGQSGARSWRHWPAGSRRNPGCATG